MSFSGGKTTSGADIINANQINATIANLTYLNVAQNTVLNNLTVTGSLNTPGGVITPNITCDTLTANIFVKTKNNVGEYALLQTTSSTASDPNQSILSTSEGSQGLDIITLGDGKRIQLISDECHMVAGYDVFPTLPVGISLFSNTLIAVDALTSIALRATTTIGLTSTQALSISGGTTSSLTSQQGLTLSGGTTASLAATQALSLTGGTTASLVSTNQGLTLTGNTTAALSTTTGALTITGKTTTTVRATDSFLALESTAAAVTVTGNTNTTITATTGAASLSGATTALVSAGGALTLQGGAASTLSAGAALTLTGTSIGITSAVNSTVRALAGNVTLDAIQVAGVGGLISLTSLSALGVGATGILLQTGTGAIALTTGGGAIALTTGAGALNFYVGVGGINIAVTGGAISMGTTAGNVSVGTSSLGTLWLYSGNSVQVTSGGGSSSAGIYLNTAASNGSGQAYNWRFPAGAGTAGQVLTSQGTSSAQTWSTVLAADANGNISANNFLSNSQTISANGTTTMTAASPFFYYVTAGGGTVIILLPNATTLPNGAMFYFNMNGTSTLSIRRSDGTTIKNFNQGSYVTFELLSNATSAGTWDFHSSLPSNVTWNSTAISGSQTFTTTNTTVSSGPGVGALICASGGISAKNAWLTQDLVLQDPTSGSFVSVRPAPVGYSAYNFTLPTSQGASGQVLTSAGAGNAMTWTTPAGGGGGGISSVGMSVPAFLSVSPSNITTTGTFAVTLSGSALPVANGGTGVTTSTGSGSNVLSTSPTLTTMNASGTNAILCFPPTINTECSMVFNSQLTNTGARWVIGQNILSSGSDSFGLYSTTTGTFIQQFTTALTTFNSKISCSNTTVASNRTTASIYTAGGIAATNAWLGQDLVLEYVSGSFVSVRPYQGTFTPYNFILPSTPGTAGQVLVSNGTGAAMSWANTATGSVTSISMTVPPFLSVSPATITSSGTFAITATSTGSGNVVLASGPTILTPTLSGLVTCSSFVAAANFKVINYDSGAISINVASFTTPNLIAGGSAFMSVGAVDTAYSECLAFRYLRAAPFGAPSYTYLYHDAQLFMQTTSLLTSFFTPLENVVPGTATSNTNFFAPSLANGNAVNLNFGKSLTTNNSAVIQFVNTGGTGSVLNSLNMGINGVNSITIRPTDTSFSTNCIFPSVRTPTIVCNDSLTIRANTSNARTIRLGAGAYQTGGIYLNAQTSSTYVALPSNEGGSTNIGNNDLGNCLFVGANQDKYIGRISANGIVNISSTETNYQFMTFYEAYRGVGTADDGLPFQAVGSIAETSTGGTVFSTTSDYRLKENIQEMPSMFSLISSLRPVIYNFKKHVSLLNHGFIAHEVQAVFPEAVVGEKDAVDEFQNILPQQLSYASFTPILTKAVQELIVLIEQQQQTIENLTQRIALLESPQ